MTELNIDALAENHYSHFDPQFDTEDETEAKMQEYYDELSRELSSTLDRIMKRAERDDVDISMFSKRFKDIICDDLYAEFEDYE